uniref:Phospholipid phosphatase 1 n=1 Tax=Geotrypetes seraphini TaxID=260995 RepID=A0A6P8QIC8_GEOSA|nr:phospholipid phosphatase 1 isoform X3 [Geotrypetes seraphini]
MFDKGRLPFVALDVVCVVLAGLPLGVLNLAKVKPYQRGFFCNDDSIKYPFHESTVTSTVLYTVGLTLPISSMILGEALSVYFNHLSSNAFIRNNYVATIYKAIGTFIFGAAVSQSLTDIAKYTIGRLRPHFLDICKPDWSKINCSFGYIENFVCQGNAVKANEGRLSFYSGHSSFSMYCMLFLAMTENDSVFKTQPDCEELQKDRLRLEHWASTLQIKFNMNKGKVMHVEKNINKHNTSPSKNQTL